MVGATDDQILEHLKQSLLLKIEAQQLEINEINAAIVKTRVLLLLFKADLSQVTSSPVITHMTNTTDHTPHNDGANKHSKPCMLHTGLDPEG